jgi:hypothetical protein
MQRRPMSEDVSQQIARDNHFVPQALLRRWSYDGTTVWAYRLLVPDSRVPEWERLPTRGLAYRRDLYTGVHGNQERDDFERWISSEFEQPGNAAIDKVLRGDRLKREDWHNLARFLAAQDVRTPSSFVTMMRRWHQYLPDLLDSTLRAAVGELELMNKQGTVPPRVEERNEFTDLFNVRLERAPDDDSGQAILSAEITPGRRMWIAAMRHLLTGVVRDLCLHQWSIAESPEGIEWPLTDHPVLKLNYYKSGAYDFGGGWGRRHSELMMPLSPKYLLLTHVGNDLGRRICLSPDRAILLRRLLVERAHRHVFMTQPTPVIPKLKPRRVDPRQFAAEATFWDQWHDVQSQVEGSN